MERLLTSEEIEKIKYVYNTDPIYRYPQIRKMYKESFSITEILTTSPKGLIMIKGNTYTGYDHICERHNFFTTKIFTKINENKINKFQNQSRFPNTISPIDFINIADSIFQSDNLIQDNKNEGAKHFDLYESIFKFPEIDSPEKIRLVLYKNTKIIHTLYPVRDTFTRKIKLLKNFLYRHDEIDVEHLNNSTHIRITIPYIDVNKKLWYAILIEKDFIQMIEKWRILIFFGNYISKYSIDYLQQPAVKNNFYKEIYQYADLREVEKFIKKIDEKFKAGLVQLPEDD